MYTLPFHTTDKSMKQLQKIACNLFWTSVLLSDLLLSCTGFPCRTFRQGIKLSVRLVLLRQNNKIYLIGRSVHRFFLFLLTLNFFFTRRALMYPLITRSFVGLVIDNSCLEAARSQMKCQGRSRLGLHHATKS
jgi:hypothetical protein